ncbi:peptidoglycan DD-metalloendopeptidase family protein [Marinobacter daepoensis]|nr:peptidoglycan DD-metalloendopeptidase family protein [Marinobacter daepoensis]
MKPPKTFTARHKALSAMAVISLLAAGLLPLQTSSALTEPSSSKAGPQTANASPGPEIPGLSAEPIHDTGEPASDTAREIEVREGDTLSEIFQANGAPLSDLHRIMEADAEFLALETLKPGTRLSLHFNQENRFSKLTLHLDPAREVVYLKREDGSFEHQQYEADTRWVTEVIRGRVDGSFYASAIQAGLNRAQIQLIDQLLGNQLNFRKDLRVGDEFRVIVGHEMAGETSTNNTRLQAVTLHRASKTHYAFRFHDGNYYDEDGNSVSPAFLRWPTSKRYRVSSPFNKNRLHPVTGRRRPHNGVDLATPSGTPVLSTGDGIVRRVGNHPYAGRYIDIDHGGAHTTRYLHLNKVLVRSGAQIQRGQKIALSGNTGRSTGPHLHFEFHIKGQPVDPLTADIPTAAAIPKAELAAFQRKVDEQLVVMKYAGSRSELLVSKAPPLFDQNTARVRQPLLRHATDSSTR